jgi:hypothetical protein
MKISRPMSVLAFLITSTLIAQDAKVTPLMSKGLAQFPGKEGLMITVVYPPGASDPIHRHNAPSSEKTRCRRGSCLEWRGFRSARLLS